MSLILFNIYSYEFPKIVTDNRVRCTVFADDFKLYISASSAFDMKNCSKLSMMSENGHWNGISQYGRKGQKSYILVNQLMI